MVQNAGMEWIVKVQFVSRLLHCPMKWVDFATVLDEKVPTFFLQPPYDIGGGRKLAAFFISCFRENPCHNFTERTLGAILI